VKQTLHQSEGLSGEQVRHNVRNTGDEPLRLYTIYSPPEHVDGVVHSTKGEGDAANEHFDGKTTEE
jgi:hypothetical protein